MAGKGKNNQKVLLVLESPIEKELFINKLPPLGILGIAAYLQSKGIETDVVDCNIRDYHYENIGEYDIVGFSLICSNVKRTLDAAQRIKEKCPNIKIIVGGPHVLTRPKELLETGFFDAVLPGEGEDTLYEYLTSEDVKCVRGIYLRQGERSIFTGTRPFRTDLDLLPFPAFKQAEMEKYVVPISQVSPISHIMTSRGCPYGCIFCFHSLGKKWRPRSAKNVVDEIEWQVKELGVKEIAISDDNFTLDRKRAEEILDLIIKRGIRVKMQVFNGIRADKVDKGLLKKMKEAGVWLIAVAPETGNEESLRRIKKGMTLEDTRKVVQWCKELGIATFGFFMIGFPWETKAHVRDTINFAEELDTDFVQFTRVLPFEGTELAEMLGAKTDLKREAGLFYGERKYKEQHLTNKKIKKLIQEAYRRCYLKPKKMWKILRLLSIRNLYTLAKYAFSSESM